MTINDDTSATLLADLVRVESVTPGRSQPAAASAPWPSSWRRLSDLPVDVTFDEIEPGA
jgi:hypothetical protein